MSINETLVLGGLLLLSVAMAVASFMVWGWMRGSYMDPQRELIDEAFKRRARTSPQFGSDLVDARLVHAIDNLFGDEPRLQSSRLYVSDSGDHFLFVCTSGEDGFLTHLSRQRAENMVKPYPEVQRREFGDSPTQH
jgi:hypothetical protein